MRLSRTQSDPSRISLLCPTRGRPEGVLRLVISALSTAECPESLEFVFYLDDDDDTFPSLADLGAKARIVRGPRLIMAELWNQCAWAATGDYLSLMADDFEFRSPGWDRLVREEFGRWPDGIILVHGNDLSPHGGSLATHFFVSRRWVETVGYITPPYFSRDWVDTWCTEVAWQVGRNWQTASHVAKRRPLRARERRSFHHGSMRFRYAAYVGWQTNSQRGWASAHSSTSGARWAARLSSTA